jgi:acetyl esterase/lipase
MGAVAAAATDTDINLGVLPDLSFYTVYLVAENMSGVLGVVKRYQKVIPRRLSMQVIASPNIFYYISYPNGHYDDPTPNPVLIYLHGGGEMTPSTVAATDQSAFLTGTKRMIKASVPAMINLGMNIPFVTISPQCRQSQFNCMTYASTVYIDAVLNTAQAALNVDTKSVYVMGVSTGGSGTWRFAMHAPNEIAAIAPFMTYGPAAVADTAGICSIASNRVGVWQFHNANDGLAPLARPQSWITIMNACASTPVPPIMTTFTGARWPASRNDAIFAGWEDDAHDAISYVLGSPYYDYDQNLHRNLATPIEPDFVAERGAVGASMGQTINSLWDWFRLHKKP